VSRSSSPSEPLLVLATLNPAKGRELAALLGPLPFRVRGLGEIPGAALPSEGAASYAANALAKARAAARAAEALALADDSGIEVDALGGAPGLLSARYGGEGLSDPERCRVLLAALRDVPPERRTARFRCVIAICEPRGREGTVEGVVEGRVLEAPRGAGGFGYDPLFYYPPLGATFAELAAEVKNTVSHRALALARAREVLLRLRAGDPAALP
jgi:XTP/dITP diphosphohydrolase